MDNDREYASYVVAIFTENNSTYTFEVLAPVNSAGFIVAGKYKGQNVNNFNVIVSQEKSLEDITGEEDVKTFVESSTRVNKAYYRINMSRLYANYVEGKLSSNFTNTSEVEKIITKYVADPANTRERNNVYRLLYFAMLRKISLDIKDVAIFENTAMKLESEEVDSVALHEISLPSYFRPSSFNGPINQVFKYIDEKIEKLYPNAEAKKDEKAISPTTGTTAIQQVKETSTPNTVVVSILDNLYKKFIGQEEAAKYLLLNIYFNIFRVSSLPNDVAARNKSTILLDGSTGTGKTAILKEIAKYLNVPVVITGATQYSTVGYKGGDLEEILFSLLSSAKGDVTLAQKGVVFFDEFDKLASNNDKDTVFKKGIQEELLRYVEGGIFQIYYGGKTINFDTSKVTFICGGAFTDLRESKMKKNSLHKVIGFSTTTNEEESKTYELTDEDFIHFGIKRELIGRLKTKIHTRSYSKEDLCNILRNSSISPLTEFLDILTSDPTYQPIVFTSEDFIEEVANMAYELDTGVRGLQEIIEGVRTFLLEDLIINRPTQINLDVAILDKVKMQKVREASK